MDGEGELRPAPLEELNEGEVTEARPASSAIVMRDAAGGPEVLLVQRNPEGRFMGGAWVFPTAA
jgi:8-oxo-dGTP pyrophosphatase MutT (NUDIX family)